MTAYKNPEWDLALDYYYTVKNGMSIEEAERVFEQFEQHHNPGWDLRLYTREYIFLYISKFGLEKLPELQYQAGENNRSHDDAGGENVMGVVSGEGLRMAILGLHLKPYVSRLTKNKHEQHWTCTDRRACAS